MLSALRVLPCEADDALATPLKRMGEHLHRARQDQSK